MFITRRHGRMLVRNGKAKEDGLVEDETNPECMWVSLTRFDLQRTDHYPAADEDIKRLRHKTLDT